MRRVLQDIYAGLGFVALVFVATGVVIAATALAVKYLAAAVVFGIGFVLLAAWVIGRDRRAR